MHGSAIVSIMNGGDLLYNVEIPATVIFPHIVEVLSLLEERKNPH